MFFFKFYADTHLPPPRVRFPEIPRICIFVRSRDALAALRLSLTHIYYAFLVPILLLILISSSPNAGRHASLGGDESNT